MKISTHFRLILVGLLSFVLLVFLAHPLKAINTNPNAINTDPPNLEQLYQPRVFPLTANVDIRDMEEASYLAKNQNPEQQISVPIRSPNPREHLVADGTFDHETREEIPITFGQVKSMTEREVALRERNSRDSFSMKQKQNSVLLASMDLNNLAQYESCVYVNAYGTVYDRCLIDLVVRDLNSGTRWLYRGVSIDKFCPYVIKSILNRTWL